MRRLCAVRVPLLVAVLLGVCAASDDDALLEEVPTNACELDQSTCKGGVLVDGECWRVGERLLALERPGAVASESSLPPVRSRSDPPVRSDSSPATALARK